MTIEFKDGGGWECDNARCSDAHTPVYEPAIYDPTTGERAWIRPWAGEQQLGVDVMESLGVAWNSAA